MLNIWLPWAQTIFRRAAPKKINALGGQHGTRSDKRRGQRPQRRAAPSKASPLGGQRSTRSDKRGGHIHA